MIENSRFQNNTGSSVLETNLLVMLPMVFNCSAVLIISMFLHKSNTFKIFVFEFATVILPLVFFLTILSNYIYIFFTIYTIIIICISIFVNTKYDLMTEWNYLIKYATITDYKLPCISHMRGMINVYSVVCILAADFTCFPKRFLKTEAFGFSLMDSGVGLYIAAFALSSSRSDSPSTLSSSFRKQLPLLLLGIGRYVSVSLLKYQHSVSEYGIHWNFFISLSVLGLVNDLLFRLINTSKNICILSILILFLYEMSLNAGLKEWILFDTYRMTFISANKEGILSLIGYETIYLFCVQIKDLLPKKGDPFCSYFYVIKKYFCIWFLFFLLTLVSYYTVGVSRKCANCGYIFWITSIILFYLIIFISFELFIYMLKMKFNLKIKSVVPLIVESVNFNGLTFFLLGNVITGMINMIFKTLLLNEMKSLLIIINYILICCVVTVILYTNKWRIR